MSNDFLGMSDADFMDAAPVNEGVVEEIHEEETEQEVEESQDEPIEEQDDAEDEEESSEEAADDGEETPQVDEDYKRILQPFKANGTEVQVRSVDEAIQLMQMGANYTKKMQALQPNLKVLKTLE